jgi:hypothetical protein
MQMPAAGAAQTLRRRLVQDATIQDFLCATAERLNANAPEARLWVV